MVCGPDFEIIAALEGVHHYPIAMAVCDDFLGIVFSLQAHQRDAFLSQDQEFMR